MIQTPIVPIKLRSCADWLRGLPPSMHPMQYNNGVQILQSPGYVIIRLEMIHETRVIPVDGRRGIDEGVKQWLGESRGRF